MYYHRGGNSANKSHETEKLPNICVVGGCSNVTDTEKGISLHFIPFTGDEMHEAKRRRVDFVHLKRAIQDPRCNFYSKFVIVKRSCKL